jgi:hypothetical protein
MIIASFMTCAQAAIVQLQYKRHIGGAVMPARGVAARQQAAVRRLALRAIRTIRR